MQAQVVLLLVLLLAVAGIAMGVEVTNIRLRRENAEKDRVGFLWHDRFDAKRVELEELQKALREMTPVFIDSQSRWGFTIPKRISDHLAFLSPREVSEWLVAAGPGIELLSDGQRSTWRGRLLPEFTGWTPPRLLAARRNGEEP